LGPGSRVLAASLLLLAAGCASAQTTEVQRLQARAAYERGLADLREGRTAPGLAALREAVSLERDNAMYHESLGKWLLALKHPALRQEAMGEFRRALVIEPLNADAHHDLGVALAEDERWEEAIAEYRKALAVPTFAQPDAAYNNIGWALYNLRRYPEANDALQLALRLNPTLPGAYYHLGLVLVAQQRLEDAKLAFRRARELAPDSPFGWAASQHLRALGDGG
jgi:tetratricopeptide (TPR) repeat protein